MNQLGDDVFSGEGGSFKEFFRILVWFPNPWRTNTEKQKTKKKIKQLSDGAQEKQNHLTNRNCGRRSKSDICEHMVGN